MALGVFGKVSKFNNNDTQPWLSDIVLPSTPMIKKRGRPKGLTQTVIGLPKEANAFFKMRTLPKEIFN
jgi:hypothetical protein